MLRISKAIWYVSVLMFPATLFYSYAGMTERLAYSGNLGPLDRFSSDELFYISLGSFLLVNILCYLLVKLIHMQKLSQPMREIWSGGLFGFASVANFFIISSMMTILFIQNEIPEYYYISLTGPVLLVIWLIVFVANLISMKFNSKKSV